MSTDKKNMRPRTGDLRAYIEVGLQLIPLHRWDAKDGRGRDRGKTPRDGAWQAREYDSRAVAATLSSSSSYPIAVTLFEFNFSK